MIRGARPGVGIDTGPRALSYAKIIEGTICDFDVNRSSSEGLLFCVKKFQDDNMCPWRRV